MPSSWERGFVGPATPEGFQPPIERVAEPQSDSFAPRPAVLPASVRRAGDPEPPPVVIPQPPQLPSEAEARAALVEAQQIKHDADAVVTAAEGAYLRATQHLADCMDDVASHDALDEEIAAFTASALRSGEGRPRVDQDDALRGKIAAREQAHASVAAARAAETTLAGELDAARTAAKGAAAAHEFALNDVLTCEAAKLAERYLDAQREADALAATCAGVGGALTGERRIFRGQYVAPASVEVATARAKNRLSAVAQWRRAADALRADATAVVDIAIEPMPEPVRRVA